MKFPEKMWLVKVTKNRVLPFVWKTLFEKPHGRGKIDTPAFLGLELQSLTLKSVLKILNSIEIYLKPRGNP